MKHNWITIFIVLVLVATTLALWETPPQNLLPLDDTNEEPQAFAYATLTGAHTQSFDEQGQLNYEFFAKTLRHFRYKPESSTLEDFTTLDEPRLTLFSDGQKWLISANSGKLSELGETLTLTENVKIQRPNAANKDYSEVELNTSKLEIRPKEKMAWTAEPVSIVSSRGEITGVGMSIDLNTQNIQLKSQVQGRYDPQP